MEKRDQFSKRENEVIVLLLQGLSNKQIAHSLGVTSRTIEFHLSNIYQKLGVNSRSEAILFFSKNNLDYDHLRDSTVETFLKTKETNTKPLMRTSMIRKVIYLAGILIMIFMCIYLTPGPNSSVGIDKSQGQIQTPETSVASTPISTIEIGTESIDQAYLFEQTIDGQVVQLIINWFYVDTIRTHLDLSICNMPLPEGFNPINLVDSTKIVLKTADSTPLGLMQHVNSGGGSGGEDENNYPNERSTCIDQTFDYFNLNSQAKISGKDFFQLEIPIGGSVIGDTGKLIEMPVTNFDISIKPTFSELLTFITLKTGIIENKTVTFKGVEINPKSATANLCIFDPDGKQWLPSVALLYNGKIITPVSVGFSDDSNTDPKLEICYRIDFSDTFQFENADELKGSLSMLVIKLSQDQPERLPVELITHVQNELSLAGIEFNYVIINHGSDIVITKKPINMTDNEVISKIYNALSRETETTHSIQFNLE